MNLVYALLFLSIIASCKDEDEALMSKTFYYEFHNGQTVTASPYLGTHPSDLSASITVEELRTGGSMISVSILNSLDGELYNVRAYDAADPATTPNGTPYNETPNSALFVSSKEGDGGTITLSQETDMSYEEIINSYNGYFVIHDPLQETSTSNISTYLVIGTFAKDQTASGLQSSSHNYDFNTGQIDAAYTYNGPHDSNLNATIVLDELADGQTRVTVRIMNAVSGESYRTHAHDMADPNTTPSGIPYNESPNPDVFVSPILATGSTAVKSKISTKTYHELTSSYNGFFVVHDPLQEISATDPTTYVILGVFAR